MQAPEEEEETSFFHLPPELRLQVWKLALPQGRVLRIAFETTNESEHAYSMSPVAIPKILHLCHESRIFAKSILRLGFGAEPTPKDRDWWNPRLDILYLPPCQPPTDWDLRKSFNFQDFQENHPYPPVDSHRDDSHIGSPTHHRSLFSMQHLALPFNCKVLHGLEFFEPSTTWLLPYLQRFPYLKTVKLLIDHVPQWYRAGDIQLYLPLNIPLDGPPLPAAALTCNTPSRIEAQIMTKMEKFRRTCSEEWVSPVVEIRVVGNTERKEQDGFCLTVSLGGGGSSMI